MKSKFRYIAVDGPIGVGKTTLVKMLAEDFKGTAILEPIKKNPFLADFYKDPKRNAFKTQLFFLLTRYQQQLELKQPDLFKQTVVCDYTFAKDAIFARTNLSEEEASLYHTIYELLEQRLPRPDIVIYLCADSEVLLQRIKKRGIDYEKSISREYLSQLTEAYNKFFLNYHETPLLVANNTGADYIGNADDYANLKREIINHRGGTVHLISR